MSINQTGNYITEEKRQDLIKELNDLKGPKRQEILEALAYAKSLGDLSENAEYHQAREEQGKLEERIAHIEEVLRESETVKGGGGDVVTIGSTVVVEKVGTGEEKTYIIVGSQEGDSSVGKISNLSPVGTALFGKKKGDKVTLTTPGGSVDYKIINVH
jgi:transcription elongation factor GreA